MEMKILIKSYIYESLDNKKIREAVRMWLEDTTSAMIRFGHISYWDVSRVTDMSGLFKEASSFNETLDNWDVTKIYGRFGYASSFNQPLKAVL
jgi:hypothetical protein